MFINIVFWLLIVIGRRDLFFRARFTSFHTHEGLSSYLLLFILFHFSGPYAWVFRKTLLHEFFIHMHNVN